MLSYIFDGYIRIPPLFRGKKHSNITRFLLFLLLLTCLKPQIKLVASGFVAAALLLLLVVVVDTKLLLLFFDTLLSKKREQRNRFIGMQSAMYNEATADDKLGEWPEILEEPLYIPSSSSIFFSLSFPLSLYIFPFRSPTELLFPIWLSSKHTFLLDFRPCLTYVLYNFFSVSVSYIENNKEHTHFQSFFLLVSF